MVHNNREVLNYWNKKEVESMYDKFLVGAEISLIKSKIPAGSKILDAGCGEGEGTLAYSKIKGCVVEAVDFSETRLGKAKDTLKGRKNVKLKKVDFLSGYDLGSDFDVIVSQRFIINLMEWKLQKKVIIDLMSHLKPGGIFLMLEGYKEGVDELNKFRGIFKLPYIPVKWHNLFLEDKKMRRLILEKRFKLIDELGLGEYFLLTRGIRPYFDKKLNWDVEFNNLAKSALLKDMLRLNTRFSRLKLWVLSK